MTTGTGDTSNMADYAFDYGYSLEDVDEFERGDITRHLERFGVPHRWEGAVLAVSSDDVYKANEVLEDIGFDPSLVGGCPTEFWAAPTTDDISSILGGLEDIFDDEYDSNVGDADGVARYELLGVAEPLRAALEVQLQAHMIDFKWEAADVLAIPSSRSGDVEAVLQHVFA